MGNKLLIVLNLILIFLLLIVVGLLFLVLLDGQIELPISFQRMAREAPSERVEERPGSLESLPRDERAATLTPGKRIHYNLEVITTSPDARPLPGVDVFINDQRVGQTDESGMLIIGRQLTEDEIYQLRVAPQLAGYRLSNREGPIVVPEQNSITYRFTLVPARKKNAVQIRLSLQTNGYPILAPLKLYHGSESIAVVDRPEVTISVDMERLSDPLRIEGPYFKPQNFQVDPENPDVTLPLEPLLVQIQCADSVGIYNDRLEGIEIYYRGQRVAVSKAEGRALVHIPRPGFLELVFYKPHVFPRQKKRLQITDLSQVYKVNLIPTPHYCYVQFVDQNENPIAGQEVFLVGRRVSENRRTNEKGIVKFTSWFLRPGVKYNLRFPSFNYTTSEFSIDESYFDADQVMVYQVNLEIECLVEADQADAQIEVYDPRGRLVASGTGKVSTRLAMGNYKAVAKVKGETYRKIFNPARDQYVKIRTTDIVQFLKKKLPRGYKPTEEDYQALKNYPVTDPFYNESLKLLGQLAMEREEYVVAYQAYNRYYQAVTLSRYDPQFLTHFGEAALKMAKRGSRENRMNFLLRAKEHLEAARTYYKEKIAMKYRDDYALRIFYDLSEVNYQLYIIYRDLENPEYERIAEDAQIAIEDFLFRYEKLSSGSPLKRKYEKQYLRVKDIYENLTIY
ncbi:MAG: hypothetical protein GXO78_05730 [Calditrichaeota bacterium]|nr:hypothetical protein [Calditrichota bacterium]